MPGISETKERLMRAALTDLSVRNFKPAEKQYKVWDTKTPGFGIRVNGNSKSWIVMYGKARTMKVLGRYPDVPLSDARKKALVELGTQNVPSTAPTFSVAKELFLAQDRWRPTSRYQIEQTLKYFHWQKTVDKITHNDVAQIIDEIAAKHQASHVLKDVRAFFNWCVPRYIQFNPCTGLKPPARYVPRERVLTDDELKAVWVAAGAMGYPFGHIVKLLALTGQRKTEISTLQKASVNKATNYITLPETKNDRTHTFPFGSLARQLLDHGPPVEQVPGDRPEQNHFLFQGRVKGQPYNGWSKHQAELLKLSKTSGWTLHDLRRTFATNLAALGTPIHITERLLNHVSGTQSGIVAVYQRHDYAAEQRQAIEAWDKRLQSIVAR